MKKRLKDSEGVQETYNPVKEDYFKNEKYDKAVESAEDLGYPERAQEKYERLIGEYISIKPEKYDKAVEFAEKIERSNWKKKSTEYGLNYIEDVLKLAKEGYEENIFPPVSSKNAYRILKNLERALVNFFKDNHYIK